MAYHRVKKLESLIQREISSIIRKEIKDPRINPLNTTISEVKSSKDLRYVIVYISVMGDEAQAQDTMTGFKSARGFIQKKIGDIVNLRFTPELSFKLDNSLYKGDKIIEKLKELVPQSSTKENLMEE
jgi:ribosome-binding factor A